MSATSLVQTVITALFALMGGSLIGFLQKLSVENQFKASLGVLGISIGALVGVYSGVYVTQYQLLTPKNLRLSGDSPHKGPLPVLYLRSSQLTDAAAIEEQYRNRQLSPTDAYAELSAVAKDIPGANAIAEQYRNKQISAEDAYEKLHDLVKNAPTH